MPKRTAKSLILLAAALLMAGTAVSTAAEVAETQGWATYKNERFGFRLSYPDGLFTPKATPNSDSGAVWTTADGARLLATATQNDSAETIESYKEFVMRESYGDAKFDYTPVKGTWFVLSGQKGDTIFYERITFVCQGRYIYGWQANYPASQRRKYDAIVEAIHRSYKPGRGESGDCAQPSQ
ncbi:MAG: hypothetical protein ABL904_07890 [Hyphomicrobiaceae bacterium]